MALRFALTIVAVSAFAVLQWRLRGVEPSVLALQFAFDPDAVRGLALRWGESGIQSVRAHDVPDAVFACAYGLLGLLVARDVASNRGWPGMRRIAIWAAPFAAAADLLENALQRAMLADLGAISPATAAIAGTVSVAKWSAVIAWVCAVVLLRTRPPSAPGRPDRSGGAG